MVVSFDDGADRPGSSGSGGGDGSPTTIPEGGMASRKHPGNLSSDMGSPSSPSRSHSRPTALSVDLDGNASTRNRADTNSSSVAGRSVPPTPASTTKRSKKAIVVNTFGAGQVQDEQLTQVDIKLRNQSALLDFRNKILEKF